jgi:hypothetical protein
MPRSDNWSRQLPRPVIVKGGDALRRLSDCRAYNPIPGRFTAQLCKFPQKELPYWVVRKLARFFGVLFPSATAQQKEPRVAPHSSRSSPGPHPGGSALQGRRVS